MSFTDLIPAADDTYNIGSATERWKEVYISSTVTMGNLTPGEVVTVGGAHDLFTVPYGFANVPKALVLRDGSGNTAVNNLTAAEIKSPTGGNLLLSADSAGATISSSIGGSSVLDVSAGQVEVHGNLVVSGGATGIMLPTLGGVAQLLDSNESGTIVSSWGGAISSTSGNISYSKVGKSVSLSWAELSHLGNGVSSPISSTASVIPSRFRPLSNMQLIAMVQRNGTWTVGHVRVLTTGTLQFFGGNPATNFSGFGMHFIPGMCVSYPVA